MNNKLDILLACLPEAPFKEQLKKAIDEEIANQADIKACKLMQELSERQGKSNLAMSVLEDNCKIQQSILMKLSEILQRKEGESITKVAEYRMKRIDDLEYVLEGLEK